MAWERGRHKGWNSVVVEGERKQSLELALSLAVTQ